MSLINREAVLCCWMTLVCLGTVLDAMVIERTFRDPFEHPLERMIMHNETGELYVGAVNNLFKLSADLKLMENVITGPADDNPKCPPPLLPCKEQKKSTNSHNQGLAFDYSRDSIIVCLSLFHGACHVRKLSNVTAVDEQMPKPIVSNHEDSSTVFLTAPGPNGDALYVASRYSNHGNKRYRDLVPSISSRNLQTLEFTYRDASGSSKVTVLPKYRTRHFVNPVHAFSHGGFVYFITTQPRTKDQNSPHVTKLARICQKDKKFESYVEVRLECRRGSKLYNLAQAGYLSKESGGKLYVAFAMGKLQSDAPVPYSAVCIYDMQDVITKFEENIRECHNGIGETGLHYLQHSKPCEKRTDPLQFCGTNFTPHASLDGRKPIMSRPVLEHSGAYFTAIASLLVGQHTLMFLGTNTGYIYKVIVKDNSSSEIIEKLLVDHHREILSNLVFTKDRRHLYLMTRDKVAMIDFLDCSSKTTCDACIKEGNPACGWCVMEGQCSNLAECTASKVQPHWVSASSGSCLQIMEVLPEELSLQNITSNAGVDQVRFKVDQMKAPPSSDNIGCLFLSGHSKEQTEALIQKNVVICPLPHHRNLPRIPKGEDNAEVNLEFQVDGKSIVKRSVKVFDCRVHKSCTECTGSTFSCQWCPFSGTCIDSSSSSCSDTNNIQSGRQVDIIDPNKCPRLVNPVADIVVHSGTKKEVRVKVENLLPEQKKNLKCHFEYLGQKKTVRADVSEPDLVCQKTEFAYTDQEIPYVPVSFRVVWGNQSLQLDNPDNIQVRAYKCRLMVTNCGKCLSMDKEYDCVWCSNKCMLASKCSGTVLKRSDTCPDPRILRFSPISGPIGGKTNVTITGINLGKHIDDLRDGVKVAGMKCKVLSHDYQQSSEFICETEVVNNAKTGTIKVEVAKKYSAESDSFFSFLTPSLKEITPKKGPKSGGTHVMIHGDHMNAGSRWDIIVGSNPCEVVSQNTSVIECVTSAEGSITAADVSVSFGGLLKHLDEKFEFVEDPTITMVEPNRSILSGGTTLTVTGTNLNLIQEPKLFIKYNSTMKESPCKSKHQNMLECRMPSLDFGENQVSLTSPKEVQYGFIMDGVVQLKNLSDNPEFRPLLYFPDPVAEPFTGERSTKKYMKGDKLVIEGKFRSINQLLTDVYVHVGNSLCTDLKPHDTALMCTPPSSPSGVDKEGNAPVVLHIGQYKSDIGYLSYYEEQEGERPIALGIILGVALPMLTIIILLTVCVVRRHMKHDPSDNYIPDVLKDYEGKKENEAIGMNHMSAGTMDSSQYISELLASFDDEQERQQITELLITRNKLDIGELLGKGNFGVAYKAQFTKCDSEPPMTVAVKSLQGTNTDQKALQQFLRDSLVFKELQHKNVLPIFGVCLTISDDPVVVVPYMETVDLRTHIRDSSKSLSVCTLLDYGLQVAEGMTYLSELKVIHHNLAARNCLLCDYKTVKLTDIGLTNELFSKDFYFTEDHTAKLPVKWMAPESVEHFVFSTQTDVWSYGVVLWELLTRGVTPYPDVVPWDVHSYLQSGRRMQKPKHCPEFIYQLMLRCWQQDSDDRPAFSEICTALRSVSTNDPSVPEDEAQPLNATVEFTGSTEYLEVIE
ncbi:plexin-A1 isoform X1 [Octopus bimaculoides]|uniref:plexin-A1 isoform X1 n=1 Tax=Octopus bimaculoides TaxID=37653 RepID=UPI00071D2B7A|nr:plexin-A1 isoform X1 [Octopus bimaculoides]XP_052824211.1 plexin-A1 isoform X1 [Octopus bimaculoides]XP_052824212.1 plexin-A1 isoform X1 [Octopus bimaculoides]|eukprot:XP_014769592.1 PREDICTED: plexin-A1-like isoform X1 [Octopus bimaculoides]